MDYLMDTLEMAQGKLEFPVFLFCLEAMLP
jgi:hypothetical protein